MTSRQRVLLLLTEGSYGGKEVATVFARVSTFLGDPAQIDQGINYIRESALPSVRPDEGFEGFYHRTLVAVTFMSAGTPTISGAWCLAYRGTGHCPSR
jgi:hypothetical protein